MSNYYDNVPVGVLANDEDVNDPSKWLDCDGSVLDAAAYPELASLLPDGEYYETTYQFRTSLESKNRYFSFSPDGSLLAVVMTPASFTTVDPDNPVYRIFNTSDWTEVTGIPDLTAEKGADDARACAFSPDGSMLAIGYTDDTNAPGLAVLNTTDWSIVSGTPTPSARVWHLAFSLDSSLLAYGMEFKFFVYRTSDWVSEGGADLNFSEFGGITFSPDGTMLACVWDDRDDPVGYTVYDPSDFSIVSTGETLHYDTSNAERLGTSKPSFSADSSQLAIIGADLGGFYLLDTTTWEESHPFPRSILAASTNHSAEFSPDGLIFILKGLFTVEDEGAQTVFRVSDWQDISPRFPDAIKSRVDYFTFSSNGDMLLFRPEANFDLSGFDVLERVVGKILPQEKRLLRMPPEVSNPRRPVKIRALP